MVSRHVQVTARTLLGIVLLAASTTSCTIPLPAPRTLQAPRATRALPAEPISTATIKPSPTVVPTNTPVILVLPTHTPKPSTPTEEPSDTPTISPISTATIVAPPTFTPKLPALTTTSVLAMATDTATAREIKVPPTATPTEQPTAAEPTSALAIRVITVAPAPSGEPTSTAKAAVAATPTPTVELKPMAQTSTPTAVEAATQVAHPEVTATAPGKLPEAMTVKPIYEMGDVIANGGFEQGFDESGVGKNWKGFDRVAGVYGWSDETWPGLTWDGQHAQMMRIIFTLEPDQYIGIQQTVAVVKGEPYELVLHGLIRSSEGSAQSSSWGYRIQWGIDPKGRDSWEVVKDWYDTGWDDQPLDAASYTINEYRATIVPTQDTLTLFIRGWRKWGIKDREVDFVIDGVSLVGPMPPSYPLNLPTTGGVIASVDWWGLSAAFVLVNVLFGLRHIRTRLYADHR